MTQSAKSAFADKKMLGRAIEIVRGTANIILVTAGK